jgi:hypothetical protein
MSEQQLILSEAAPPQGALFDYASLDAESRIVIQQKTGEIKTIAKRMARDVVDIGERLAEIKDRLNSSERFVAWLGAELGWSERAAYYYIAVFQKFAGEDFEVAKIATSALYLLAAPSTPPAAVETVKRLTREGEKITHTVAKAVVEEAKVAEKRAEGKLFEEPEASADAVEPESVEEVDPVEEIEGTPAVAAPAKSAGKAKPAPAPKLDAKAKEIEQAWRKSKVNISLQYLPADSSGRRVMVTIQADGVDPDGRFSKLKHETDVQFIGPLLELLEDYKRALPAKIAAKKAAKAPAKPASKPAAKAATKGAKK